MPDEDFSVSDGSFPWNLGVYDAHCHPTDVMASIKAIRSMKARALTIMSTRNEDQNLVAQVADELGVKDGKAITENPASECRVVPSFGWHPWFSHQLYDDLSTGFDRARIREEGGGDDAWQIEHYESVLEPSAAQDREFLKSLPRPQPLSEQLARTRALLEKYPLALVGEVGLDKSFRLPTAWAAAGDGEQRDASLTPGGREGRRLSPYRVAMAHQKAVLQRQLHLAGEMQRAVSLHGVQAHGVLFEALRDTWKGSERKTVSKRLLKQQRSGEVPTPGQGIIDTAGTSSTGDGIGGEAQRKEGPKTYPPRICLHSYSGPQQGLKQYLDATVPVEVFFSFSSVINFSKTPPEKVRNVIRSIPDDRLLVESDLHCAGDRMDGYLEEIARIICQAKGWPLEEGVARLARNWARFILGHE